ncbi:hypothetical protein Q4463_04625, partial [Bacteroides caccae]|nr:hypothetical protein [Bacteroides caccae]MDO6340225.1 hypothetical protein [Bacteroides caccae]MDO6357295.1 hypothetical protein [Bacteroides caccae]
RMHCKDTILRTQNNWPYSKFIPNSGNCMYNSANNIPDLMKDMKRWQLSPIDRRNYERFRKVALGIYRQAGIIDFTTLETTPIKNV